MSLKNKRVVVTGGTRGLGLGLVEALVDEGAKVWVVARDAADLEKGAGTIGGGDGLGRHHRRVSRKQHPLGCASGGADPQCRGGAAYGAVRLYQLEEFTTTWDTDVKGGLYWMQAALNLPLAPGSRVLVSSSGAAQQGSPMSGGYGGAKRMLWLMAKYANGLSEQKGLGIRFQAIVPKQMVGGTGVGGAGSSAYAQAMGIEQDAFLARYPAMPPRHFGNHVVQVLTDATYDLGARHWDQR